MKNQPPLQFFLSVSWNRHFYEKYHTRKHSFTYSSSAQEGPISSQHSTVSHRNHWMEAQRPSAVTGEAFWMLHLCNAPKSTAVFRPRGAQPLCYNYSSQDSGKHCSAKREPKCGLPSTASCVPPLPDCSCFDITILTPSP